MQGPYKGPYLCTRVHYITLCEMEILEKEKIGIGIFSASKYPNAGNRVYLQFQCGRIEK